MAYGLPYIGSKNLIARELLQHMPRRDYFVDLFAGGGAMWQAAAESGKYSRYLVNEYNEQQCDFLRDCADGIYNERNEWVTRDEFVQHCIESAFLRCVWSFGNTSDCYFCASVLEEWEEAIFHAYEFNDYKIFKEIGFAGDTVYLEDIKRRPEWYKRKYMEHKDLDANSKDFIILKEKRYWNACFPKRGLERLRAFHKQCERMDIVRKTDFSSKSYDEVDIPENALIYCDHPYINTTGYGVEFDHARFYDWCRAQKELVLISEYTMPDDFIPIWRKNKCVTLCSGGAKKAEEKLFIHKSQMPILYKRNGGYQMKLFL